MRTAYPRAVHPVTWLKPTILVAGLIGALLFPMLTSLHIAYASGGPGNTRGDDWGHTEVNASNWLTSLGGGVTIYSNGPTVLGPQQDINNCVTVPGGTGGLGCGKGTVPSGIKWQCVELINRLYLTKGWITSRWVGIGADLFGNAPLNLKKEANGSITYLNPGDVIGFGGGYKGLGHVAIVNSVNGSTVQIASQNTTKVFDSSLTLNNGRLMTKAWSGYTIQGVIHRPSTPPQPKNPSQPAFYASKIVQWSGDTKAQKTAWFVSPDLKRYWIPDSSTYNCLRSQGVAFAGAISSTLLDKLPDQTGKSARCGNDSLGTNQFLFRGSYLRSSNGQYSLQLQGSDGNLVLYGPGGALWANAQISDYLVMQGDNNLVTYRYGTGATWATNTGNTAANTLVVQNDGNLVLYAPGGVPIWDRHSGRLNTGSGGSSTSASAYAGKIVQWSGDTKAQKTAWFVSPDLKRYWIPDSSTYNCLRSQGVAFAGAISSTLLDQLPDQTGKSARCGNDSLGTNQFLFRGSYLRSSNGQYSLQLQGSDGNLVLYGPGGALWANSKSSDFLVMQGDNNLVTYKYGVGATWATNTGNTGGNTLVVQNDGNLVLYAPGGVPIWDRYHGRLR